MDFGFTDFGSQVSASLSATQSNDSASAVAARARVLCNLPAEQPRLSGIITGPLEALRLSELTVCVLL